MVIYFFLLKPSTARKTSIGTAKTIVLLWSELISLIELRVRRWRAPGEVARRLAALAKF